MHQAEIVANYHRTRRALTDASVQMHYKVVTENHRDEAIDAVASMRMLEDHKDLIDAATEAAIAFDQMNTDMRRREIEAIERSTAFALLAREGN